LTRLIDPEGWVKEMYVARERESVGSDAAVRSCVGVLERMESRRRSKGSCVGVAADMVTAYWCSEGKSFNGVDEGGSLLLALKAEARFKRPRKQIQVAQSSHVSAFHFSHEPVTVDRLGAA